ncbi:MAG: NAD-dependent epimerase/dehydratase family protein [Actinomycetota bacterium]
MAVLVTGGAGFIGSHVAEALVAGGEDVVVLDDLSSGKRENLPDGVEFVEGDIREPQDELFAAVNPSVCFHLAAQADVRVSVERPDHDAEINVLGTINLLQAALEQDTRLVFSSTGGAIYGECERPATEDSPRQPLAPYGTSKLAGEEYLATYNRLHETRHVTLRYGNVYGPRQDPHGEAGVVAIFFKRLLSGEQPKIFGTGGQTRDYVYVADVVRATLAAAEREGGVFNVGTGRETSVVELLDLCKRVAGKQDVESTFAPPRPGELQRSVLDVSRAVDELGWRPEHSLEDGLRETWEWMSA